MVAAPSFVTCAFPSFVGCGWSVSHRDQGDERYSAGAGKQAATMPSVEEAVDDYYYLAATNHRVVRRTLSATYTVCAAGGCLFGYDPETTLPCLSSLAPRNLKPRTGRKLCV